MNNAFSLIFSFFGNHPFILIIFIIGLAILIIKFLIWLISFMIIEIVSRVYVGLYEKYNLKFNFIEYINNNEIKEEFDNIEIENLDNNL